MDVNTVAWEIVSRLDQEGLLTDSNEAQMIIESVLQEFEESDD